MKIQKSRNYHPVKGDEPLMTDVHLKMWTPFKTVALKVDQLCVPIEKVKVMANQHNTIGVKIRHQAWSTHLIMFWADTSLKHEEGMEIPLPYKVKIPRHLVQLVNDIIGAKGMVASILLKCGPTQKEHKFDARLVLSTPTFGRKKQRSPSRDYGYPGQALKRSRPSSLDVKPMYDLTHMEQRYGPSPNSRVSSHKRLPSGNGNGCPRVIVRTNPRIGYKEEIGIFSDPELPDHKRRRATKTPSPTSMRLALPPPATSPPPPPKVNYKRQLGSMATFSDID